MSTERRTPTSTLWTLSSRPSQSSSSEAAATATTSEGEEAATTRLPGATNSGLRPMVHLGRACLKILCSLIISGELFVKRNYPIVMYKKNSLDMCIYLKRIVLTISPSIICLPKPQVYKRRPPRWSTSRKGQWRPLCLPSTSHSGRSASGTSKTCSTDPASSASTSRVMTPSTAWWRKRWGGASLPG